MPAPIHVLPGLPCCRLGARAPARCLVTAPCNASQLCLTTPVTFVPLSFTAGGTVGDEGVHRAHRRLRGAGKRPLHYCGMQRTPAVGGFPLALATHSHVGHASRLHCGAAATICSPHRPPLQTDTFTNPIFKDSLRRLFTPAGEEGYLGLNSNATFEVHCRQAGQQLLWQDWAALAGAGHHLSRMQFNPVHPTPLQAPQSCHPLKNNKTRVLPHAARTSRWRECWAPPRRWRRSRRWCRSRCEVEAAVQSI